MAVTKNELVFDLLNIARGGLQGADEHISEAQVSFWIDNVRARLIRNDLEKRRSMNPDIIQTLGCVDVSQVDASSCGCINTECEVITTDALVPRPLEVGSRNLITSVGPINLTDPRYNLVPYERAIWANPNKYSYKIPVAFQHDGYIYIIGEDVESLEKINIQGIFETPADVKTFITCSGDTCYDDDQPYPIARYMIEDLKKMILDVDFRTAVSAPTDTQGDSSHKVEPNIQQ